MYVFPIFVGNWNNILGGGDGGLTLVEAIGTQQQIIDSTVSVNSIVFKIDNSVCDGWMEAKYFLAKDFGVIRKIVPELSESWILKEFFAVN